MLVERYPPVSLFAFVPKLLCEFEPVLRELDTLLEDDQILQRLKADLARRAPNSLSRGRPSTPVEVILRLLVVKRLYGWSYEEVEHFVSDSLVLRQFCRVYLEKVPDDTTLLRWANLIEPATLEVRTAVRECASAWRLGGPGRGGARVYRLELFLGLGLNQLGKAEGCSQWSSMRGFAMPARSRD